jgi:hypothetical protein
VEVLFAEDMFKTLPEVILKMSDGYKKSFEAYSSRRCNQRRVALS